MRPRRLQLRGFTTFRSMPEALEFEDVDLFALTGPTGSGKTSLLDAMCFALYGRVPRLDARSVEPVISLGATEARILFEFSVGADEYSVGRVIRRTRTGATTAEARLEALVDGDRVALASGADEVTHDVGELLGLTFEHFTKTVLLPQGEFAAFLHDKPSDRQKLLRTLLDLGVYETMRELALARRARADGEASVLEREIARLEGATEDRARQIAGRVSRLEAALARVRATQPRIEEIKAEIETSRKSIEDTARIVTTLRSTTTPDEVLSLGDSLTAAIARVDVESEMYEQAVEVLENEERAASERRSLGELSELRGLWRRSADLRARSEALTVELDRADDSLTAAIRSRRDAEAAEAAARGALARLENEHRAHAVAAGLSQGMDCPVCGHAIDGPLGLSTPDDLESHRRTLELTVDSLRAAEALATEALTRRTATAESIAQTDADLAELEARLAGEPGAAAVEAALAEVVAGEASIAAARKSVHSARRRLDDARTSVEALRRGEREWRRRLSSHRDRVMEVGPPELLGESLNEDWSAFILWSGDRANELEAESSELQSALERSELELSDLLAVAVHEAASLGVDTAGGSPAEALAGALGEGRREEERIRGDIEARSSAVEQLRDVTSRQTVAKALAQHLQANRFEAWLMEEAIHGLTAGANILLQQLSNGAYSLEHDKRDFSVIDHRNADETRPVKTLSGGETFLVSLALALALAEQIGVMAGGGRARLESIFLDEGFGTLDGETLDVVASVIQELGAAGRTVGIVTHVPELAELVPTRFVVTRTAAGSRVERIDA